MSNTPSSDWYETNGLRIHYDGIDNTGFGHSNHTDIWFNLADHSGFHGLPSLVTNAGLTNRWESNRLDCTSSGSALTTMCIDNLPQWSIEMVFSISSLTSSEQQLFSNIEAGGYELELSSSGIPMVRVYKNGGYRFQRDSSPVVPGVIYSISGTWDGTVLSLYNGGNLITSGTFDEGSTKASNTVFGLFCNPKGYSTLTNTTYGYIYAVRYYSRPLSASEVAHNYNLDNSRFEITETNSAILS